MGKKPSVNQIPKVDQNWNVKRNLQITQKTNSIVKKNKQNTLIEIFKKDINNISQARKDIQNLSH